MLQASDLSISEGEDHATVQAEASRLIEEGKWQLCNDGKGVERNFRFKTFKATWNFMNRVAGECQSTRHHPEWSNVYNRTHIRWTTHVPPGLSGKDTAMARFCDEVAAELNELPSEPSSGETRAGVEGKLDARDCCGRGGQM